MLHTFLDLLTFDGTGKMKLAMLTFLYYREFVKNSIGLLSGFGLPPRTIG